MLLPLKNQPTNQSISLLAGFALWTVFSPQNSDSCKKQNPISIIMNAWKEGFLLLVAWEILLYRGIYQMFLAMEIQDFGTMTLPDRTAVLGSCLDILKCTIYIYFPSEVSAKAN